MGDDQSSPALRVGVVDARGRAVRAPGLARWLASVAPPRARGTVTIALVSDARMRALNRTYRGQDYATDVLSFPSAPGSGLQAPGSRRPATGPALPTAHPLYPARRAPHPAHSADRAPRALHAAPRTVRTVRAGTDGPPHLGDLVIATGVAARQARAEGHAAGVEVRVLALHGLLHLLGYDHETDAGAMRRVEARLRRRGGLPGGLIERGTAR
jgi:probable rRNA maturation factor